jgi:hypothetical protein
MANNNRNFNAGNKKFSDLVIRITFEASQTATNMTDFVDNVNTAMACIKGVTPLDEDSERDVIGRTYNFLALEHHAKVKAGCIAIMGRFGNDPTLVVKEFADMVSVMKEPRAKSRKPRREARAEEGEGSAEARTEARTEARAEAQASAESESESSGLEEVHVHTSKPEPEKKPKVVLPKKK